MNKKKILCLSNKASILFQKILDIILELVETKQQGKELHTIPTKIHLLCLTEEKHTGLE